MLLLELIYVFSLGLVCGSFIYTTQLRLISEKSLLTPSHCDHCKKKVGLIGLIPIVGYLFYRGHCRFCKKKISFSYPIFELINALLFLLIYLKTSDIVGFIHAIIFFESLIVISFIDFKTKYIYPHPIVFAFLAQIFFLLFAKPFNQIDFILGLFIGAGVFHYIAYFFLVVRGKEGLGSGDATLLGLIGFYLGWQQLIPVIFLSSVGGVVFGLLSLGLSSGNKSKRKKTAHAIALGPWLSFGAFLAWYFPEIRYFWNIN